MSSTIDKGNAFRDLVAAMMEAAGFHPETEVRVDFKKVDVRALREDMDGPLTYLVEAKDHSGTLTMSECREFVADYGTLVRAGEADRAWLVSRGDISPDGRRMVDADRAMRAMTFAEFQRRLVGIDGYLRHMVAVHEDDGIESWYVRPHTVDGRDLEAVVRAWLIEPDALPLAVVAGYGMGKSTFARHLTAALAAEALKDPSRRVPILVPLGDIVDEQALEGLLGKVFTSRAGARGYNFDLFSHLNAAGRFVVVFDGFDEMKHGMTMARFESEIVELMRIDRGAAKMMILGRDTAFHDDVEFRSVIHGRQRTSRGNEVPAQGRRAFRELGIRDFTLDEARAFVRRYFPALAREAARGRPGMDAAWIDARGEELLSGRFDALLQRPVHAQMLCQVATDPDIPLADLSIHGLFDRFVHFLIDREVAKRGRDPRFPLDMRRRFNAELALWLWQQGGASTISLSSIPASICRSASEGYRHDLGEEALRRELTAGCLVEKSKATIYFGHRSLQEFLVAEAMIDRWGGRVSEGGEVMEVLKLATPEVSRFVVEGALATPGVAAAVAGWAPALAKVRRTDVPTAGLRMLVDLAAVPGVTQPQLGQDPWFSWLSYFVANGRVDFAPNGQAAADAFLDLLRRGLRAADSETMGVLLLAANVLRLDTQWRVRLGVATLAAWLRPGDLVEALSIARDRKKGEFAYVARDRRLAFWTFLKCARVERRGAPSVDVDLDELARVCGPKARMGLSPDPGVGLAANSSLSVPVQMLYRAWDIREGEIERVRPFFGDDALRDKIKPLEIDVVTPRRPEAAKRPLDAGAR